MAITKQIYPIKTKDDNGQVNGVLFPIYNIHDGFQRCGVEQVYLTTCSVGKSKGPHLHKVRWGYFTCISGNVRIVIRMPNGDYSVTMSGDTYGYRTVEVPPGLPARIDNIGYKEALILNCTSPAWTKEDQDDWVVEGWNYD